MADTHHETLDEKVSVLLAAALTRVWSKIRALNSGVPGVVLLTAPANGRQLNVLGHFAALRWNGRREGGQVLHEVVVVAEHLNRSAEDVAETLLHEAAHALNFERRVFDCSANQYHNKKFRAAAEGLGLVVKQVPNYGFAATSMPKATAAIYSEEIDLLRKVSIHRRPMVFLPPGKNPPGGDTSPDDDTGPASRNRKATCGCPFIIRVSRQVIASTTIRCESCGEAFRLA